MTGSQVILKEDMHNQLVCFLITAYNGHAECLRILLENVENEDAVNCIDDQGRTPLMVAVSNGHIDATLLLLHYRSRLNLQDIHHRTALHRGVILSKTDYSIL